MRFKIIQQRVRCIGCNACVEAAPQRWRISRKDGRCTLVDGVEKKGFFATTIDASELDENRKAMRNCPVGIIQVREC